jgi:general secretion pathway protein G
MRHRTGFSPRGFTLIEVMIAIALVVALGGVVGLLVFQRKADADVGVVRIQMNEVKRALEMFRLDFGRFPTDDEGLAVLWSRDTLDPDADETKWRANLASPKPRDNWGSAWGYRAEGEAREGYYDLWSYGPDKQDGTDDDIMLWEAEDDAETSRRSGGRGGL